MSKEQVKSIEFNKTPDVRIRVIEDTDTEATKQAKIKYPFELFCTVTVTVITDKREFSFDVYNGYTYNGSDIPRCLWSLVGSRTDTQFLIAALIHDYALEMKAFIYKEVLKQSISIAEYRRLTSLMFREKLKDCGVNTVKANIMSWAVDVFQHYGNRKGWKIKQS